MFDLFKGLKKSVILYSIVVIILGIILILYPNTSTQMICYIIAGLIIFSGVVNLVRYFSTDFEFSYKYDLFNGILLCVIGLFMIIRSDVVIMMIPLIFGFFLIIDGIVNMRRAFQLKNYQYNYWNIDFILAILLLVLGIIMILNPFAAVMTSVMFIGACFIYDGLLNLIVLHRSSKLAKEFNKILE